MGEYQFWLAAKGPFDGLNQQEGNNIAANAARKIDGFGMGLSIGRDLEVSLELMARTPEDALQLYQTAQGFVALMKAGNADPEAKKMLDNLRLNNDGKVLGAWFRIPEEEILAQIARQRAKAEAQSRPTVQRESAASPAAAPTPAPPPRRRTGGIRIFGASEEPIEVPVAPRP